MNTVHTTNAKKHARQHEARTENLQKAIEFARTITAAGVTGKRALVSIQAQHNVSTHEARLILKAAMQKRGGRKRS